MTPSHDVDVAACDAAAASFVDDLSARDGRAARTRMMLFAVEEDGDELGWHHPGTNAVFQLYCNVHSGDIGLGWSEYVTKSVRHVMSRNGNDMGQAFLFVADYFEKLAAGQLEDQLSSQLQGRFARTSADVDLVTSDEPDWVFYGYGVRSECLTVPADALADELYAEGRMTEHPELAYVREVRFTARDGLVWFLSRQRGGEPTMRSHAPESDTPVIDDVCHALSRMTNAVAGNAVPIAPR